jgi:thiazole/oxazole-forming peptide maturase SagD family component
MCRVRIPIMSDPWHQSRFTGLFRSAGVVRLAAHDPQVHLWAGTLLRDAARDQDISTSGIGWNSEVAFGAGVGEAIERYRCRPLVTDTVVTGSCREWSLDEPFVQLERWVLFHPEQYATPDFPFARPEATTQLRWVCCRQARTGSAWWVPVEMVYLDVPPGGPLLAPSISTGLVCGSAEDLALRGAQEVIERDGVVGAWWGRYPLHECDPDRVWALLGEVLRERLVRPNLTYRFYRIESPFSGHVVLVTLEGDDHAGRIFSVGSACRSTRRAAWERATLEAVQGRIHLRQLLPTDMSRYFRDGWPTDFTGHALFYSRHPEKLARTPLARPTAERGDPYLGTTEPLAALSERLGPERPILLRHLSRPELQEIGEVRVVLRVVIPGLQPLHGHHGYPFLGGPLWQPRGIAEWASLLPHPFP